MTSSGVKPLSTSSSISRQGASPRAANGTVECPPTTTRAPSSATRCARRFMFSNPETYIAAFARDGSGAEDAGGVARRSKTASVGSIHGCRARARERQAEVDLERGRALIDIPLGEAPGLLGVARDDGVGGIRWALAVDMRAGGEDPGRGQTIRGNHPAQLDELLFPLAGIPE